MSPTDTWRTVVTLEPPPLRDEEGPQSKDMLVVVKSAGGHRRELLRREFAVLSLLRDAGLVSAVELLDRADRTELVTVRAGATNATDPDLPVERRRTALAAGCDTLARLHERGWAHGHPTLDHLVVTARGGARWCSWGGAVTLAEHPDALRIDRRVLARAAADLAATTDDRRLRRRLARLGDEPDPIEVARLLRRLPRRGRRVVRWSAALAIGVSAGALLVGSPSGRPDRTQAASRSVPAATPGDTVVGAHGEIDLGGSRARIGRPGDRVLAPDPACAAAEVLLLRPATGQVFGFPTDGSAAAGPVGGRSLGNWPGARGLARGDGCAEARIVLADGSTTPLPPAP